MMSENCFRSFKNDVTKVYELSFMFYADNKITVPHVPNKSFSAFCKKTPTFGPL